MIRFCFKFKYFAFIFLFYANFVFASTPIKKLELSVEKKSCVKTSVEINIPKDADNLDALEDKIKNIFSGEVFVENLTCNFDLNFQQKEFLYLVGFNNGDSINSKKLISAVSALIKKNKFEKIVVEIEKEKSDINKSVNINFVLTGCWIFSKVKVSGIWVGKTEYARYYAMEPGDVFSLENHNHSINKLKNLLKTQGYFNSDVSSNINYDKSAKLVSVDIFFNRKSKFSISDVDFFISKASDKKIDKIDKLKTKIDKLFKDKLIKNQYSKALIEREIVELKKYLSKKGFLHVDIELVEKINYLEDKVDLKFILTLHSKKEFVFSGNNFFPSSKLLEKILIYGRSAWLVPGSILSGEIAKEYQDKGFWNIKIDVKEGSSGYSFFIKEGERACINKVELAGVNSLDANILIKTCFEPILSSEYFDQELLDKSLDDFVSAYLAAGFWDIKVLKHNFSKQEFNSKLERKPKKEFKKLFKKDKNEYRKEFYKLVVSIDEGEKSYLKAIAIKKVAKDFDNSGIKVCPVGEIVSANNSVENNSLDLVGYMQKDKLCENFDSILQDGPFKKFNSKYSSGLNCLTFDSNKVAFDVGILSEQKNWLLKYFKDKGNLYAEVNLNLERDGQNVSVVWEVDPGKLVTFGKTIVLSGKAVETDYVMRELQYKEGDIWDNNKLKASVARLRSLGVFETVHLYPYKASVKEEQKDILLKLNPTDPYEIRTRVGLERYGISKSSIFGQGFTYKLGGAFLFKNPLKKADQFMVDFDVALTYRNASLSYIVPWVFDKQIKTTFKAYANRYEQPGFMCSKTNLYQAKQDGFLVGFDKSYKKLNFTCNTGLEWLETSVKTESIDLAKKVARAINFDSCLLGKKIPYLWVEPIFLLNTVDDKINPRSGYFTLVSMKGMLPTERKYIDSFFVKFMAEQSFFRAITSRITGAFRFRCGHIFHKNFKDITPIERFYLGGAHSIRSYEKDMCPPWGIFCDKTKSFGDSNRISSPKIGLEQDVLESSNGIDLESSVPSQGDNLTNIAKSRACQNQWVIAPQGGRTTVSANLEARFDIYKSMSGVIFQDMGSLFDDKFCKSNFAQATGLGVRFNTAVGPIRFDIGWKWKVRNQYESRCAWFLAFGNAF